MITQLLLSALMLVESGNNPKAKNGDEVGVLQITPAVIRDVNRKYKTTYRLKDRLNVDMSKSICGLYLKMWGTKANIGREPTDEDLARIWNGGPKGFNKRSTINYWRVKVLPAMQSIDPNYFDKQL